MPHTQTPLTQQPPNQRRATDLSLGAAIVAVVNAFVALAISFGVNLSPQQQTEITSLVNAVIILVVAGSHFYSQLQQERERWSHMDSPE